MIENNISNKKNIIYINDGNNEIEDIKEIDKYTADKKKDEEYFDFYDDDDDDDDDKQKIGEIDEKDFESKKLGQYIVKIPNASLLSSFPFVKKSQNHRIIYPIEIYRWKIKSGQIIAGSKYSISRRYGNEMKKLGLAAFKDLEPYDWYLPYFFKTSDGHFFGKKTDITKIGDMYYLRLGHNEIWDVTGMEQLYMPNIKITKVKNTAKNKERNCGKKYGNQQLIKWMIYFQIEGIEYKIGIEHLVNANKYHVITLSQKITEGVCKYCNFDCSKMSTKISWCPSIGTGGFTDQILQMIVENEKFKLEEVRIMNIIQSESFNVGEVKKILINNYYYQEYSSTPKWTLEVSYEVKIKNKLKKKKTHCSYNKDGWNMPILGDLNEKEKDEIKRQLTDSDELKNFLVNHIDEKEETAERPNLTVLRISTSNNKHVSEEEYSVIEFEIDFKLSYEKETILCTYERWNYFNEGNISSRDFYDSKGDFYVRKTFLKFDEYVYEQIRNSEYVKRNLSDI